jgi:hypothetical protein
MAERISLEASERSWAGRQIAGYEGYDQKGERSQKP